MFVIVYVCVFSTFRDIRPEGKENRGEALRTQLDVLNMSVWSKDFIPHSETIRFRDGNQSNTDGSANPSSRLKTIKAYTKRAFQNNYHTAAAKSVQTNHITRPLGWSYSTDHYLRQGY